jgi:hypothetical protein
MAARIHKRHTDEIRARIQAALLINRLHDCAMGEIELTPTQLTAINALLDRSVPKLQQIQHVGDDEGGPIRIIASSLDESI